MSVFPSEKVLCETRKAKPARHRLSEPIWVQFLKELFDSATSLFLSSVLRYSLTWTLFFLPFLLLSFCLVIVVQSPATSLCYSKASNNRTYWKTPFHMAWHKGHFDVVELMLNNQFKDLKFLKIDSSLC